MRAFSFPSLQSFGWRRLESQRGLGAIRNAAKVLRGDSRSPLKDRLHLHATRASAPERSDGGCFRSFIGPLGLLLVRLRLVPLRLRAYKARLLLCPCHHAGA